MPLVEDGEGCLEILADRLRDRPGVIAIEADFRESTLTVRYQPALVSPDDLNALADDVGREISALLHAPREDLTPEARGTVAVRVAAVKQLATDIALEVGTKIYELTGARASSNKVGLDLYWRNARTHTLHDPVAYKRREVGEYALLGKIPEPSWYT